MESALDVAFCVSIEGELCAGVSEGGCDADEVSEADGDVANSVVRFRRR